ncbi:phosphonate metabolism transcriptional regulator PhnF [Paludibacterium paludis]|uniref:Phosphonate metabolism transcriptional regulator PhnF n=1 Tax=Paludibacterium paludis TaxID=1225769 RepID=A0A918NYC3_9NEIS|nr:phosphonate metabolism transcriptional regulator PhnF [Paludibacterium paludis]GGY04087.1 phosphonate metabolism transcriptional regulator PhnF [Paludibacterium paludis]
MIERGSGVAVWRQIETALAQDIAAGRLKPAERIPTELELADRFGVNRHTIRRAVAALVERGALRVEQGRGTFVQENAIDYAITRRTRFSRNMARQNLSAQVEMVASETRPGSGELCGLLGLAAGADVHCITTVSRVEGRILDASSLFFPAERFPGLREVYARERSVTRTLRHFGVDDYTRKFSRITARLPDSETQTLLHIPKNRPILHVKSLNVDPQGRPVQYGLTRFNGDLVQLTVEDE